LVAYGHDMGRKVLGDVANWMRESTLFLGKRRNRTRLRGTAISITTQQQKKCNFCIRCKVFDFRGERSSLLHDCVAGLNGFGDMHKTSKLVYILTLVAVAIEKCSTLKSRSISGLLVSATVCWN
jgi:hypothetical protein